MEKQNEEEKTMMRENELIREEPAGNIFSADISSDEGQLIAAAPIRQYSAYFDPRRDSAALETGEKLARMIRENIVADFEKSEAYCRRFPQDHVDQMVHVSTFKIIGSVIYMTYYANTSTEAEDPYHQEARLAFCPMGRPEEMTIYTIQKVGDTLDGKVIDRVYDTILMEKGDGLLYILWTASADGLYYRLYCTYDIAANRLSAIRPNRFRVGNVTNDFSATGITTALAANGLGHKGFFSDIGIMQKVTTRVENGEVMYYTGTYSGYFNALIKSRDFITWEFVAAPDFVNLSVWENAVYLLNDRCYYFVRQEDCNQGFLTYYDLNTGRWQQPVLIRDAQSRGDFFMDGGRLYLVHAPRDRDGVGLVLVDTDDLARSRPIAVADLHESIFYPYTDLHDGDVYMSYTVDRKHIRLTRFSLKALLA